jgi:hypothetical protein
MNKRVGPSIKNVVAAKRGRIVTMVLSISFLVLLFSAPRMKSQVPSTAAPSALKPAMEPLAFFIGEWNCLGEFIVSMKPVAAHISAAPDLDRSWISFRWTDREPSTFHALELFGFDKTARHFTNFIHDNFGGVRLFNSPGWEGDTLTWTGNELVTSAPPSERFVIERKSAKEFVITWETRKPQADWAAGDRLTCRQ